MRSLLPAVGLCLGLLGGSLANAQPAVIGTPTGTGPAAETNRYYIPYEQLRGLLRAENEGVFLSRNEYRTLAEKARAATAARAEVALPVLFRSAVYRGEPTDRQLRLTAEIRFRQFTDGWVTVPLDMENLGVLSAKLDDEPARLGSGDRPVLFSREPGDHVLTLELVTPLLTDGTDRFARFKPLTVPASRIELEIPWDKRLHLGDRILEPSATEADTATYRLPLTTGPAVEPVTAPNPPPVQQEMQQRAETPSIPISGPVTLRIADPDQEANADPLLFVRTAIGARVDVGELRWSASLTLAPTGRELNTVELLMPSELEIVAVDSTGLDGWSVDAAPDSDRQRLSLRYRQPITDSREIALRGLREIPTDQSWTVPAIEVETATVHTGRVVVEHAPGVRLEVTDRSDLRPIFIPVPTGKGGTSNASGPAPVTFAFWESEFDLELTTRIRQAETLVEDVLSRLELGERELTFRTLGQLRCLYAPIFETTAELTPGWTVTEITLDGQRLDWRPDGEPGSNRITIDFPQPLRPGRSAALVLTARRFLRSETDDERRNLPLPAWRFPEAVAVSGGYVIVSAPPLGSDSQTEQTRTSGDSSPWRVRVENLVGLEPEALGIPRERAGFRFVDDEFSGELVLTPAPSKFAIETLDHIRLTRTNLVIHREHRVEPIGGGVRELTVRYPVRFSNLRFESPEPIVTLTEQSGSTVGDETEYTLRFDRRVTQPFTLVTKIRRPLETGNGTDGEAEAIPIPVPTWPGTGRVSGVMLFEADERQRLTIDTTGEAVTELDPLDRPRSRVGYSPTDRVVHLLGYVGSDPGVTLSESRFDPVPLPRAIGSDLTIETTLGSTDADAGARQHHLTLNFRAVGVQGLKVMLPESARLWATVLDGQPVEVRRRGETVSVPLSASDDFDSVRRLELFYATTPTDGHSGRITETAPEILVAVEDGDASLTVIDRNWIVRHPRGSLVVGVGDGYRSDGDLDRPGWVASIPSTLGSLSADDLGRRLGLLVGGGVLILIGTVLWIGLGQTQISPVSCLIVIGILLAAVLVASFVLYGMSAEEHDSAQSSVERLEAITSGGETAGDLEKLSPKTHNYDEKENAAAEDFEEEMSAPRSREGSESDGEFDRPIESNSESGEAAKKAEKQRDDKPGDRFQPGTDPQSDPFAQQKPQSGDGQSSREQPPMDNATPDFRPPPAPRPSRQPLGEQAQSEVPAAPPTDAARLSLRIDPVDPDGWDEKVFESRGAVTGDVLTLRYQSRGRRLGLIGCVVAGLLLLGWLTRHLSAWRKGMQLCLLLMIPMVLAPILPTMFSPILDGLFLGGVAVGLLWTLHGVTERMRDRWIPATGAITLLILFGSSSDGFAQPLPGSPGTSPFVVPAERSGEGSLLESLMIGDAVVIPYRLGADPLKADRVFLTRERYRSLLNRAGLDERTARTAPVRGMVAAAMFRMDLTDLPVTDRKPTAAPVTGTITLANLTDKPITLPLPLGSVALTEATFGEIAAGVKTESDPNTPLRVTVPDSGLSELAVRFDVSARIANRSGSVTVPIRGVPSGSLTVTIPGTGLDVSVTGIDGGFREQTADNTTQLEIPLGTVTTTAPEPISNAPANQSLAKRGRSITISWKPRSARGDRTVLVGVAGEHRFRIDDGGIGLTTALDYQISRGTLTETELSLPEDFRVRSVVGSRIASWSVTETDAEGNPLDERRLRLRFRGGITDSVSVTVRLHRTAAYRRRERGFTVSPPRAVGIERERGLVTVDASETLTLRVATVTDLRQTERAVLTAAERNRITSRDLYRLAGPNASLTVRVARKDAELALTGRYRMRIGRQSITQAADLSLDFSGVPQNRIVFQLPFGYQPLTVRADYLVDWYGTEDDDGFSLLILELDRPRLGTVSVNLTGRQTRMPDEDFVEVAIPTPLDVTSVEEELRLWIDPAFRATIEENWAWKSLGPNATSKQANRSVREPDFAFRTDDPSRFLHLVLSPAEAEVSGESILLTTVTDALTVQGVGLRFTVTRAATDRFSFVIPSWFSDELTLRPEPIRQIDREEISGNRVLWTVSLHRPQSGEVFLFGEAKFPPSPDREITLPVIKLVATPQETGDDGNPIGMTDPTPLPLQQRFAVLTNASRSRLVLNTPEAITAIEPSRVPFRLGEELIAQADGVYRLIAPDTSVTWNRLAPARSRTVPATVMRADLTSVLAEDGTYRMQADYRVRNRSRQFLALELPEETVILSVFVQDRPARAVRPDNKPDAADTGRRVFIALPKTSRADRPFGVSVVLQGRLPAETVPGSLDLSGEELQLPTARVVTPEMSDEYGIAVGQTTWKVYLPDGVRAQVIDDPKKTNMVELTDAERQRLTLAEKLQTARELANVVEGTASERTRRKAISNLDRIRAEAEAVNRERQSSYSGKRSIISDEEDELQTQLSDLTEQVEELKSQMSDDRGGEFWSDENGRDLKQLEQPVQEQVIDRQFDDFYSYNDGRVSGKSRWRSDPVIESDPENSPVVPATRKPVGGKADKESSKQRELATIDDLRRQNDALGVLPQQQPMGDPAGLRNHTVINSTDANLSGFLRDDVPYFPSGPSDRFNREDNLRAAEADRREKLNGQQLGGFGDGSGPLPDDTAITTTDRFGSGLSLRIELPTEGRVIRMTKVGGSPELTLNTWSPEVVQTGIGVGWSLGWLLALVLSLTVLWRAGLGVGHRFAVPAVVCGLGAVLFLMFGGGAGVIFAGLFAVGFTMLAIGWARTRFVRPTQSGPVE